MQSNRVLIELLLAAGTLCMANSPENGMLQSLISGHDVDVHVLELVTIRFNNFLCINAHIIHISCSMECMF